MSEKDKFLSRLEARRGEGLVDIKFLFQPLKAVEPEAIFAALNEVEGAIDGEACVRHSKWNGDEPAYAAA